MLKAANKMFNKYGMLYCLIALIVAIIFPFTFSTNIKYSTIVLLMIVMSMSGASEFFAIGRCRALLYANQKTYICTVIQAISILGSLILALIMLYLNTDIIFVQFSISFVYVIRAYFLTRYVRKYYPEISNYKTVEPINSVVEKRNDAMIHQLSGLVVTGSQTIILTSIVGLQAASIYSIYNIVFSGLQSICSNLSIALTPFVGREWALNNRQRMLKMYDLIEFFFFYIVTFIYSVTVVMIIPFVSLYTRGADIRYEYPIFATIFVYTSAFYILKMPSNSLINISGQFKETKYRAILEGVLTLSFSIVFTYLWGINGVVLGTGIALAWRCIDTIIYTDKNVLKCNNLKSIFRLIRCLIILTFITIVQSKFTIIVSNYLIWIKNSLVVSFIVLVILILNALIFDTKTVKELIKIIKTRKL